MKMNIPDEYVPLIVKGLEHYYAYTRAVQRDDSRYRKAADWFQGELTAKSHVSAKSVPAQKVSPRRRESVRNVFAYSAKLSNLNGRAVKLPDIPRGKSLQACGQSGLARDALPAADAVRAGIAWCIFPRAIHEAKRLWKIAGFRYVIAVTLFKKNSCCAFSTQWNPPGRASRSQLRQASPTIRTRPLERSLSLQLPKFLRHLDNSGAVRLVLDQLCHRLRESPAEFTDCSYSILLPGFDHLKPRQRLTCPSSGEDHASTQCGVQDIFQKPRKQKTMSNREKRIETVIELCYSSRI